MQVLAGMQRDSLQDDSRDDVGEETEVDEVSEVVGVGVTEVVDRIQASGTMRSVERVMVRLKSRSRPVSRFRKFLLSLAQNLCFARIISFLFSKICGATIVLRFAL